MKFVPYMTVLACVLLGAPASAEEAPGSRVSLAATLGALFRSSPAFSLYAAETRDAEGARLRASGAFDLVATAGVQRQRTLIAMGLGGLTDERYSEAQAQVGASLRTRENVSMQVSGSVPFWSSLDPKVSPNQPQVTGLLTIPLTKFGRGTGPAADEQAASLHASASLAAQEDSESDLTAQVAEEYWHWVGAYEEWKVARRLEALAADQLKDVDELIANHARAAMDRLAFAAAAEDAAAALAQAQQSMLEQRQRVWERIGLPAPPGDALPMDALPAVAPPPLDGRELSRRARNHSLARPVLRALAEEVEAAAVRMKAAQIAERPDLNLTAQGTVLPVDAYDPNALVYPYPTAATPTHLDYYGLVSLQGSFPIPNRAARGAYEQASAAHDASLLNAHQQRNAVEVRLDALGSAIATLAQTFQERGVSTEQFRQEYEAVRLRFRLGSATATDVVVAEQQYMRASLRLVEDNTAYAATLAALAHEAGVLVSPVHARDPAAAVSRLTTLQL